MTIFRASSCIVRFAVFLMLVSIAGFATAQETGTTSESPAVDPAVQKEIDTYVAAFNKADATAVADSFTSGGELIDEEGTIYQGREKLTEVLKKYFEQFPGAQLSITVDSVRKLSDTVMIVEGNREITLPDDAGAVSLRFVAVHLKEKDRWLVASLREFANDPVPTTQDYLAPLAFLVGSWIDESPEGVTKVTFRWSDDGNYLLGEYELRATTRDGIRSSQRIGWDPVQGKIRSWIFDSDGGFGESTWTQVEDRFVAKSTATLPDGQTASATIELQPITADRFVIKSTDRIIGSRREENSEITIVRTPPAASKSEEKK